MDKETLRKVSEAVAELGKVLETGKRAEYAFAVERARGGWALWHSGASSGSREALGLVQHILKLFESDPDSVKSCIEEAGAIVDQEWDEFASSNGIDVDDAIARQRWIDELPQADNIPAD